ncbi:MAG: hypothetical protein KAJ19_29065 [Gammaproteobacteria bacterium]|nr:hypothetical protein [Gammaproteobacteria bacterium]
MLSKSCFTHSTSAPATKQIFFIVVSIGILFLASVVPATAGNTARVEVEYGVEEIAVARVTGTLSSPITLSAPSEKPLDLFEDRNTFIRYTSVVPFGTKKNLTAKISSGSLPRGCAMKLAVVGVSGNGQAGNATGEEIRITNSPQSIIASIGNCYTGTGETDGAQIACWLVVEDESQVVQGESTSITITFDLN